MEASATGRYIRTSAQKAGLVLNVIRGRDVNSALVVLRYMRKAVARDIEKVLRSAIANAQQRDGFSGDVERLVVTACYANGGPSQKRVRPAPMGRAFRIVKRTAHLTVQVGERTVRSVEAVQLESEENDTEERQVTQSTPVSKRKRSPRKSAVKRRKSN
ncbi:MAG: 50S ribosomal protein L22 [Acidobacteria bacterium]|nr:50S ribosomal protein L22 [Acidobacteriota bacterium]